MSISIYQLDYVGSIFLISLIILSSMILVKSNIDVAFSQTQPVVTTFKVNESTYTANSSMKGNQIVLNGTISKEFDITSTSNTLNSSSHNPTYSVTNATIAVKTGTLEGLESNKLTFVNQTQIIISPQENVIIGKN